MSLKSYLREMESAHLGSKKAWVAHQSAPSPTRISITVPNAALDWTTYTPPSDGYITVMPFDMCRFDIRATCVASNWVQDKGWRAGTVPVRRGETVEIKIFSSVVTDAALLNRVYFIPSIANE